MTIIRLVQSGTLDIMSPYQMATKSRLNPEQTAAVNHIDGPQLILAGAGSGKTTVITNRISNMVSKGITPGAIVAVTFTNKSAREMKERLQKMLGRKKTRGMVVSTFHSLGNRILQKEITALGFRTPFSILSPEDLQNLLADIYRKNKLDPADIKDDGIIFKISLCKNSRMSAEDYASLHIHNFSVDLFVNIYKEYQDSLKSLNAVDFDDLILLPARIFKQCPDVLDKYKSRWKYFMIDEYQDTNPSQYDFLCTLVKPNNNICVVGDDDQSIYTWRGADIEIILNFEKDFPNSHIVHLETNYRSTQKILQAANTVIANNKKRISKKLRSVAGPGLNLKGFVGMDEVREANLISREIRRQIITNKREPGDFAILFRTNFQSRVFEQELRNLNIPHHVVGGYRFFDRREVKDIIAYLRILANPNDDVALLRIINQPKRGIGQGTIKKITQYLMNLPQDNKLGINHALEHMISQPGLIKGIRTETINTIYEFLEFLSEYRSRFAKTRRLTPVLSQMISDLKFEMEFRRNGDSENTARARILNLSEVVNMLAYMEKNWEESEPPKIFDFLARLSMMAQDTDDDHPKGRVQLLTLHLSKGLEFPVVFLSGLEEGLFPAARTLDENGPDALNEERRLFYVGITRAKKELFLSYANTRHKFGETIDVEPSRFFAELPENTPEWLVREDQPITAEEEQIALTGFLDALQSI